MESKLAELVKSFPTTPFLFVGSGLSRRYRNLPDWKGLLSIFAQRINDDEFTFSSYENKAKMSISTVSLYPKIATLIERDFNERWFSDASFRKVNSSDLEHIKNGVSPFKVEIACFIRNYTQIEARYQDEITKLTNLSKKSISGIITTNYDCFLEDTMDSFTTFIGQDQLVFSAIQGIAEIYKIHGCITHPDSIIINEADYNVFEEKSAYLAAKLLTIFIEYPIVFLGYSINDANVQNIIKSLVNCLSAQNLDKLENRFVFVEYVKDLTEVKISNHTINFDGKLIAMKKIELDNFCSLYDALSSKKAALPVRILRLFKQEFYDFTIANTPTAHLFVGEIDDSRINDEDLMLAIGKESEMGRVGLKGISCDDWYVHVVMSHLKFTSDELLEYAYPTLIKQSNILPLNKYIAEATKDFPDCKAKKFDSFDSIINNTYKKERNRIAIPNRSVNGIWNQRDFSFEKKTRLIAHLNENEINLPELEGILKSLLKSSTNYFETLTAQEKSGLRLLIRIYDYLKFCKK